METNSKHTIMMEANVTNIEATFKKIQEMSDAKGYTVKGDMTLTNKLPAAGKIHFDSKRKMKVTRNYINRLNERASMSQANMFLHFLFKRILGLDSAPRIEYSEKERKIQNARKAWKVAQVAADKLHLEYTTEKGDFYKKKHLDAVSK